MSYRALVADPSETVRGQIIAALESVGLFSRIDVATDGEEAYRLLRQSAVDLLVTDLALPKVDGEEILKRCKEHESLQEVAVLLLADSTDVDRIVQCLNHGASDYLCKPVDPAELAARVQIQMRIKAVREGLHQKNQHLHQLARTDSLTGLANHQDLLDFLEREIKRSQRKQEPCSLVMIEVDRFSQITQTHGTTAGDSVLQITASTLTRQLRDYDMAARCEAGLFALVLPETPMNRAMQVAERIRLDMVTQDVHGRCNGLKATLSLGVAAYPLSRIETATDLLNAAQKALAQSKEAGGNGVTAMSRSAS